MQKQVGGMSSERHEPSVVGFLNRLSIIVFGALAAIEIVWLLFSISAGILIAYSVENWSSIERLVLGGAITIVLFLAGLIVSWIVVLIWKALFWLVTGESFLSKRNAD